VLGPKAVVSGRKWWCISVIPIFKRLRQDDLEFKISLGYITGSRPVRLAQK
jgi:hypothetical protein